MGVMPAFKRYLLVLLVEGLPSSMVCMLATVSVYRAKKLE